MSDTMITVLVARHPTMGLIPVSYADRHNLHVAGLGRFFPTDHSVVSVSSALRSAAKRMGLKLQTVRYAPPAPGTLRLA